MTDKEKKSKIADILMDFQEEYSNEVINRPMLASLYAGNILSFIDSLQEEPKKCMYSKDNYTDEDRKILCDGCEEDCKYNKKESVSEELNTAAKVYADNITDKIGYKLQLRRAVVYGAKWQKEKINEALLSEVLPCFMHGGEADEVVAKLDEVLNKKK